MMLRQATLDFHHRAIPDRWRNKKVWSTKASQAFDVCRGIDLKPLLPYLCFFIYCAIGSCLFYFIERNTTITYDHRATNESNKCLCGELYGASLFYVLSLSSTIGFGTVYACTVGTKTLSIFYSLIGIPLVLMILSDVGSRMCRLVRNIYVPIYRSYRRLYQLFVDWRERRRASKLRGNSFDSILNRWTKLPYIDEAVVVCDGELDLNISDSEDSEVDLFLFHDTGIDEQKPDKDKKPDSESLGSTDEEPDIPVSLGVILTLSCIFMLSAYYSRIEHYAPAESVYYSLLTYVAGDFVPTDFNYAAPVYALIFLGFSMLSLTISIVQNNIENLMKRVRRDVQREIIKQLEKNSDGKGGQQKSTEEIMNEIMKKHGGGAWMQSVISQKQIDSLHDFADNAANQVNAYVQTDPDDDEGPPPILAHKCVSCCVKVQEKASNTVSAVMVDCQINALPDLASICVQVGPLTSDVAVFANIIPDQLKSTQTFVPTSQAYTQAKPDVAEKETHQSVSLEDKSFVVKPKTRTVAIQFPRVVTPNTQPWRLF